MDGMSSDIFTIVMIILIVIILYWIYLDHSDKNRFLRDNPNVTETSQKHEYHSRTPDEKKSSGVAVVASFFIPGLGQIYNGQIGKGVLFIIIHGLFVLIGIILIFGGIVGAILTGNVFGGISVTLIGITLYPIFWVYNLYDAYNTAKRTHL